MRLARIQPALAEDYPALLRCRRIQVDGGDLHLVQPHLRLATVDALCGDPRDLIPAESELRPSPRGARVLHVTAVGAAERGPRPTTGRVGYPATVLFYGREDEARPGRPLAQVARLVLGAHLVS